METTPLFISTLLMLLFSSSNAHGTNRALFILGDSTVDVGNNNFIDTISWSKANYFPYGENSFLMKPTGRFGDGRIIVDFIAEYAGLPVIPPYADRTADFSNGANFASGGAGVMPQTNQGMVIDLKSQLHQFDEHCQSISGRNGYIKTKQLLSDAIYFINVGSNDYLSGYLGNPATQEPFDAENFVSMVVGNLTEAIQVLYLKGARKIACLGIGPLGCLPALRAKDPRGGCLAMGSALAEAHNIGLLGAIADLKFKFTDLELVYGNLFHFLTKRLENPARHGFIEAFWSCCGSGAYRDEFTCGKGDDVKGYEVCIDPSQHAWWDAYRHTELIHQQLAAALWNGSSDEVQPINLCHLFKSPPLSTHPMSCSTSHLSADGALIAQLQYGTTHQSDWQFLSKPHKQSSGKPSFL